MTVEAFDAVDVIAAKRDGRALRKEQIDWVIDAYTRGVVAEEQMAALAMAIFINDMDPSEIADWTQAMIASGERMDFSSLSRPTSDKHSTGGVGDKITLPLVRWSQSSTSPSRSCPAAGSATPGARSTSSSPSPVGGRV